MTMPGRADARGVVHTEPVETHRNGGGYGQPVVTEDGQDLAEAWRNWVQGTLDNERAVMIPWFEKMLGKLGDELLDLIGPQLKKIGELELQVARMRGALDVLRGRGLPGALNIRGTYDSLTPYGHLDVVALNGGSFVALKDAPGPCPGDGWQLLASCGRRGPRGERGLQGPTGASAPHLRSVSFDARSMCFRTRMSDGSEGPTVSLDCIFSGVDVDPSDYSIKVAMIDGTELKFSLRGLFEQFFHELKGDATHL
jgi:hypothetical protein